MKVLTASIVALLALAAFVSPTTAQSGTVATLPAEPGAEDAFVNRINAARADVGLEPLRRDADLVAAARDWAAWMGERRVLRHADDIVTGAPRDWTKAGENVGRGSALDAIWDAFMASPSHAANVLDPAFTRIGVGAVRTPDGVLYTTHRFAGALSDQSAPPDELVFADSGPDTATGSDAPGSTGALRSVDPMRLRSMMLLLLSASG